MGFRRSQQIQLPYRLGWLIPGTLELTRGGAVGFRDGRKLNKAMQRKVDATHPIYIQLDIEMQGKTGPRSTRGRQNKAEFPEVRIISEDGNPWIWILL